jgi:hypothetical protein
MRRRGRWAGLATVVAVLTASLVAPAAAHASPAPGVPSGSFYTELISVYTGNCLNVRHGSTDRMAIIQQYHCDHTPAAKFLFVWAGTDATGADYYKIQNQASHYCVQIAQNGYSQPVLVWQLECGTTQTPFLTDNWKLVPAPGGYKVVNMANWWPTALCLDTGATADDWTPITFSTCGPLQWGQDWWLHLG